MKIAVQRDCCPFTDAVRARHPSHDVQPVVRAELCLPEMGRLDHAELRPYPHRPLLQLLPSELQVRLACGGAGGWGCRLNTGDKLNKSSEEAI